MLGFPTLTPDGRVLLLTKAARSFCMGMLSVVLGLYFSALGFESLAIGAILALALLAEAAWTFGIAMVADRFGRRAMLRLSAALMAVTGLALALGPPVWLAAGLAALGAMSPTGKDTGPSLPVEQAALPQTAAASHRTAAFAWYNLVSSLAAALGALAAGLPSLLQAAGFSERDAFRPIPLIYSLGALVLVGLFARLTDRVEPETTSAAGTRGWVGLHRSRGTVLRLSGLFGVDAFAGGFIVQSLVAYWFHLRYGLDAATLGAVFFAVNLLAGVSALAAPPLAARIGLINTMVFTHLPSNVMLVLVPFMPDAWLAVGLFIARSLISQMDVPTRQSYTMAVVAPDERSAAAGMTTVVRSVAASAAPTLVGGALQASAYALPFVLSGGLKIAYDVALWLTFRSLRAPEEARARPSPARVAAGGKP